MHRAVAFIRIAVTVAAVALLVQAAAGAFSTVNGALTTALKTPR
jgi:hypothetical protein